MEKVESIFSAKYFPVGLLRDLTGFPRNVGKWGDRERVILHSQRKGQYGEIVRNEVSGNKRNFIDTAKCLKTFLSSMVQVGCSDSFWLNIGSCGGVCFKLLEGVFHSSRFCLEVE